MHSSLLRGGGGGFSVVFRLCESAVIRNSGLNLALAAGRLRALFCPWGFGSVLFDNCIGRKRDVGGGVLAGLRLSGGIQAKDWGRSGDWSPKRQLPVTFQKFIAL